MNSRTVYLFLTMFVTICDGYTLMKTSPSISFQSTLQQQLTQRTKYTCSKSRTGFTNCIIRTNNSLLNVSPSEVWDSYNAALVTDPLLVKSVTAGIILGAADFAGQAFENANSKNDDNSETKPVDYGRAARFALFGFVLQAPWNHYYYLLLDNQIPPTPTEPFSTTNIIKVLIDQFIQAPIFTVLIFVFLGLLEGKAIQSIQQQLENDYKDTIVANWKLWIPATIINIAFVPPLLRVLYLNGVFFFWSIYLSLVVNKKEENLL